MSTVLFNAQIYFVLVLQYCGVRWTPLAHNIPYFLIVFLTLLTFLMHETSY
uniref:Uncharacterized protein n=1 Tax=Ciona intestinalis TaxID=7719 RepID=H2XZN4_CIOIN